MSEAWYVVQVWGGEDYRARDWLAARGWRIWLPECVVRKKLRRATITAKGPLFPGYLFVARDPRMSIAAGPMVLRPLLTDGEPAILGRHEVADLRARLTADGGLLQIEDGGKRRRFAGGDRVRLTGGMWSDWEALYVATVKDRIKILLDIFGRGTETTVPEALVELA